MTDNHHCLALDINPDDGPVNLRTITRGNPFGTGEVFRCSLVEFQGHVFSVEISHGGVRWAEVLRIDISRLNLNTQEWEQVDSVKDQVFFLGDEYDVCCLALSSDQERGGHIFFTFYNEKLIYSYNIAQKSLSIALRYPDLPMPCSRPAWVMPNYRLVDDQEKSKSEIVVGKDEIVDQEEKRMMEVKHNKESDCKDSKVIDLLGFPQTIIEELADRLVLLDYFNFRLVCKRFSMAAPAICWRQTLKMKSAESCLFPPCLMFIGGDDRKAYNLIDTKFSGRYFMRIPEELEDATICFSNKGWLLLRKNDTPMFFYNPFTRVVLRCPDKPRMSLPFVRFVLSSVPTSSECLVVGIVATGDKRVFIQILQGKVWTRLDFSYESDFEPNSPVFWNGAFYILGEKGNLGVLKREEAGDYSWNVLDDPKPPCEPFTFNQNFLVECDKDLLSIFVGDFGKWVRVFRLDQSGLVWNEVYSLGSKTLHLSRSSSFSTVAMYKEMENRIYFPRLHRGSLVFYSLDTHKLHSCNFPEDSLVDFCGSSEQLLCGWIEPKWS